MCINIYQYVPYKIVIIKIFIHLKAIMNLLQINMYYAFSWKLSIVIFSKTKKVRRGTVLHIFLQISLMSALIEDSWICFCTHSSAICYFGWNSWIFISVSAFAVAICCFGWNIWRKSGFMQLYIWKVKYFNTLLR